MRPNNESEVSMSDKNSFNLTKNEIITQKIPDNKEFINNDKEIDNKP